jgi:23S rRNA (guanosine2251-2'-O)-methyltransferase
MVGQRRHRSRKVPLMASHQRCWLWGRHLVLDTLRAGHWPVVELRVADGLSVADRDAVTHLAGAAGIPVSVESTARLTQLCSSADHQGWLAKMRPFPYRQLSEVMPSESHPAALAIVDRMQDAHNFGAVIRAAEVLGMDGIVVGTTAQAKVGSQVARSSAGAVNHLPIAHVSDLLATSDELRRAGLSLVASAANAGTALRELDLTGPTVFVLGNEHDGVNPDLLDVCDATVHIPQLGRTESLNVAVAAGILFYELQRQRRGCP